MFGLVISSCRNDICAVSQFLVQSRGQIEIMKMLHPGKIIGKCILNNKCSSYSRYFLHLNYPSEFYSQNSKHHLLENFVSSYSGIGRLVLMCTNTNEKRCWNCQNTLKESMILCNSCNTLQPIDRHMNLFQILGVGRSYKIDQADLRKKYLSLQSLLHPDKFTSKPKKEQELSEECSSVVNKAYSTLLDPLERGLYLLGLHNLSIEEGSTDVDKMFLMEIMERNEEIENETDAQKLKEFNANNKEQLDFLIGKIEEAFDSDDLKLAKKLLTEMKYYNSIEKKIKDIKQRLNIPD